MTRTRRSAKDQGTRFETWTARYLDARLPDRVEKRRRTGARDQGDLTGVRTATGLDVVVECKDYAGKYGGLLPKWLSEAEAERVNAGADLGVVVFKRGGCGETKMGRQFAVMELGTLARLLGAAEEREER